MDIEYVAKLARLKLSKAEKDKFSRQLADILNYVNKLNQLDTKGVEPTHHVVRETHIRPRPDQVLPSLAASDVERLSVHVENGLFLVPPVIE